MKAVKWALAMILAATMAMGFVACDVQTPGVSSVTTSPRQQPIDIRIQGLTGAVGMGLTRLMEDRGRNDPPLRRYTGVVAVTAERAAEAISQNMADIAVVPADAAARLYRQTGGQVQAAAVTLLGDWSLVEVGDTIQKIDDLKGKTIYAVGPESMASHVLQHLMTQNKLSKKVKIQFKEAKELTAMLSNGEAKLVMLGEPQATEVLSTTANARIALRLSDEWTRTTGSMLTVGCIVVRKGFVQDHPDAFDAFLSDYKDSNRYALSNPQEAALLMEKYGIFSRAGIAQKAMNNINTVFLTGTSMKEQLSGFLNILHGQAPAFLDGALPDDAFYYQP